VSITVVLGSGTRIILVLGPIRDGVRCRHGPMCQLQENGHECGEEDLGVSDMRLLFDLEEKLNESRKHTIATHMVMSSKPNDLMIRVRQYTRSERAKSATAKPTMT